MPDHGPQKPSSAEEEYFAREEAEKLRKLALDVKRQTAADELERLKKQHWMRCPKCGLELHTIHMRNVDVDACMSCGGLWLDRGEIEKMEKAPAHGAMAAFLNWFKPERQAPGRK
jgi:Zn-finger nucleic acid-binding protein